jgi:hypothetical protein
MMEVSEICEAARKADLRIDACEAIERTGQTG